MFAKKIIKRLFTALGLDMAILTERIGYWSISSALQENRMLGLTKKLREVEPDIAKQYSKAVERYNEYHELKLRGMHAFQYSLIEKAVESLPNLDLTVVDIGDSAGTHMRYLQELNKTGRSIDTISVNLDPRAIEKIRARGMKAILSRAEELDIGGKKIDLCVSFETVEHLHNPSIFFRRMAKKSQCDKLVVTVPYRKKSRVGLYHTRLPRGIAYAEEEHIFELSPEDWSLLMLHSGWRVVYSGIYYQYPRKLPIISFLLKLYWRVSDFEGFWGVILEKDMLISDNYQDWEV